MRKKIREQDEPSHDMLDLRALLQDPDVQVCIIKSMCIYILTMPVGCNVLS